jgi:hypothetical protein
MAETLYAVRPISVKQAQEWCRVVHRHLPEVQGGLFASSVNRDEQRVAIGIAGNPARVWQGTGRVVISRVAAIWLPFVTDSRGNFHPAPACTMIYRSLCDAARALGYREAWTYTLPGECGASLRAAGFIYMGETKGEEWDRPSRARKAAISAVKKGRWVRPLTREARRGIEQYLEERLAA